MQSSCRGPVMYFASLHGRPVVLVGHDRYHQPLNDRLIRADSNQIGVALDLPAESLEGIGRVQPGGEFAGSPGRPPYSVLG